MKYLYCVIPTKEQQTFDVQGIGGEVYTIPYGDISLVVSDSHPIPFTSLRKDEIVNYLLRHQSIIEKIMQNYSVVPFKFGTFLNGDDETQKIMKRGYKLFKETLEALNGKIELNLVALWADLNEVLKAIGETDEIRQLKENISQRPAAEIVQSGIELGKMVKDLLDAKRDTIAEEINSVLHDKACVFRKHAVLNDNMICNIAYLIDKNKKDNFDQALDELDKRIEGIPRAESREKINFKMVGPLPPYSFATFEIKKSTPDEIFYAKAVLGVTGEPNPEEVKQSYHAMAQKLHPDKNPESPDAAGQFEELKKAFDLLYEYSQNGRDLFFIKKLSWEQLSAKS